MEEKKKFNLSKNDGEIKGPSKFNLSKGEEPKPVADTKKKSKAFPYVAIGVAIIIIGLGIWYFTSKPSSSGSQPEQTMQNPESSEPITDSAQLNEEKTGTDTTAQKSNVREVTVTAASLNNKIPAEFASKSTSPGSIDDKLVNDLITYLSKNPNAKLTILGYASSEGSLAVNQTLSQKRAEAFKEYLVGKGIPTERIQSVGKGIENPIASNDTEDGRVKNRRVEILLQ
jgi:outer membrane protein OmpA-like peptidoglycan-associated protein